jgi:tRNA-specific 2-thiouridylase
MIAVGLSGGADSAAAALLLHDSGEALCGITGYFGESNPGSEKLEKARYICRYIGVDHHVIDVSKAFASIKNYFCSEYLAGNTPNPCVICNRDIKFDFLLKMAIGFGADKVATGHYVRRGFERGRYFVAQTREVNSQEYFLGLVSQDALRQTVFPLEDTTKEDAHGIVETSGLAVPRHETSQDVCFLDSGQYVPFILSSTGHSLKPGPIVNSQGHIIGRHRGALNYTIGQRKGLGMGFGRRVYVLGIDMALNTITVGGLDEWPHRGFIIRSVNYMKIPGVDAPTEALVKVRYRQSSEYALIEPGQGGELLVHYRGLFSPGQLAVVYDHEDAVLCAGIITAAFSPEKSQPLRKGM